MSFMIVDLVYFNLGSIISLMYVDFDIFFLIYLFLNAGQCEDFGRKLS